MLMTLLHILLAIVLIALGLVVLIGLVIALVPLRVEIRRIMTIMMNRSLRAESRGIMTIGASSGKNYI